MKNSDKKKETTTPPVIFPPVSPEEQQRIAEIQAESIKKRFEKIQELVRQGKPLPKVY